jgi:hypothetical protein
MLPANAFLSPDPLGNAAGMDLYSYANDDPIDGLDPTGRCTDTTNTSSPGTIVTSGNSITELPQAYASTPTGVYVAVHLLPPQLAVNPFNYSFPNYYPNETTGGDVAQGVTNATVLPVMRGLTGVQNLLDDAFGNPMFGQAMGAATNGVQNYFQANPYSNAYQVSNFLTMATTAVVAQSLPLIGDLSFVPDILDTANLATTPLNQTVTGVSEDALVHFAPQQYPVIQPKAGGQVFSFQYGDISNLTPRQIETLIGPLSTGGQTGGASVMHVLDAPIESAVKMPGAVVTEFPEYIFDNQVPVSGAFKVQ